jgi:hypothetical protein
MIYAILSIVVFPFVIGYIYGFSQEDFRGVVEKADYDDVLGI